VGLYLLHRFPGQLFDPLLALLTLKMVFASIFASGLVARQAGESDPRYIVSDEWAGMWLALWPARNHAIDAFSSTGRLAGFASVLAAFLLFRLFDIWKPWPVRKLEALPGGWGITMDDVAAGILSGLLVHCALIFV
jgi:phosphatidylglycerophosphatase A